MNWIEFSKQRPKEAPVRDVLVDFGEGIPNRYHIAAASAVAHSFTVMRWAEIRVAPEHILRGKSFGRNEEQQN